MRPTLILAAALAATAATAQDQPVLTVYTYDSFVSEWGPGPAVEAAFEDTCACDLQFVAAGDGAAVLSRLRLEGDRTYADIVLGLDTNLTADAAETGLFAPHGLDPDSLDTALDLLPVGWEDDTFIPYDWGYFAFVHDTALDSVPGDFRALGESDTTILIQDPRSSTPGLGLLLWVEAAYGEDAETVWDALADNIVTVTPGWTEAYNLFLEGEADMVLSYTTSPAYHLIAEEDDSKSAAPFAEGHYMQIEVAARLATSDQPDLAVEFLRFMLTDAFQSTIPTTNWMYPVAMPDAGLPDGFGSLVEPDTALLIPSGQVPETREAALETWQRALSR